jgi:myo-inositol-1-phosphate synthase
VDTAENIEVKYVNRFTLYDETETVATPVLQQKSIITGKKVPKMGVMLVGLGGNNGSTFTAGILANRKQLQWETKNGTHSANFFGSFTQSATTHVGFKFDQENGQLTDVHKTIKDLLPMVNPIDFEIGGWDISDLNLYESCKRAKVLEPTLLDQLKADLEQIKPLPAVLNPDFIAANQEDRADNVVKGTNQELIDKLRADIRAMKEKVDKVLVLWTANTEMFLLPEINSVDDLELRIKNNTPLPASVLYCVAALQENVIYLNGSPQNTFHPAIVEYATLHNGFIAGSDFKSGQTRFKTIMSDFLIGSGIRISSVVSYNHLGNNDGKNLSEDKCF